MTNYHLIDKWEILRQSFYPNDRKSICPDNATDILIGVEEGINVSCRFYAASPEFPTLLYFHGNGEIASDYDDIAPYFHERCSVNIVVAEFRGYGGSDGYPTFAGVIADAHLIFRGIQDELTRKNYRKEIWLMGRSMGSIPALELAANYPREIRGLIIESGFTSVTRTFERKQISIPNEHLELIENECSEKIRRITMPALIIHGEHDRLVDISEAYALEKEVGSTEKRLFIIAGADHNTILGADFDGYFQVISDFVKH